MLTLLSKNPTLTLGNAKAWARQRKAKRTDQVDQYLEELWVFAKRFGLDPAVLAAQSSEETDGWTSSWWTDHLNPAGIGVTGVAGAGETYPNGKTAARAHVVHMLIYARPTVLHRVPYQYLSLDKRFNGPWFAGYAGDVKTTKDLTGRWAADLAYDQKIDTHYDGIKKAVAQPGPTPAEPTNAPLPTNITYLATGNRNARTLGQKPVAIVYHITDDMSFTNVKSWFQNPASDASSNVVIDRDGRIYQFVSSTETAWTNNDIKSPRNDIDWLNQAVAKNWINGGPYSLNDFTISIEHVGTPEEPPTEAQYQSSIAISKYWIDRYHIPKNRGHLLRHGDINSTGRAYCPGPDFDLRRIILAVGGDPLVLNP